MSLMLHHRFVIRLLLVIAASTTLPAQSVAPTPDQKHITDIEHRLDTVTDTLERTQKALQQSLAEIQRLRSELNAMRAQPNAGAPSQGMIIPAPADVASSTSQPDGSKATEADPQTTREQQAILQAEIKQHEQTKVESASKYHLTITGLALFNAFSNAGVVDNTELPALALARNPGSSHGSVGGTLRQTILGVEGTGPIIFGARSSAYVNADFFGGASTNTFGYTSLSGYVRLRDSQLGLDWNHTTLQVGTMEPLFTPLSPTSYATLAMPALSASGNLWSWWPQVRVEQRVPLSEKRGLSLEAGLVVPQSPAYNSIQLDSPVQASRRPGVEGRVSFHADRTASAPRRSLAFGVAAYSASQFYSSTTRVRSWAVTGDYQIPITKFLDLSGEVYRGRSLGGFGGGLYKDILIGTNPITGLASSVGVDTAGGWTQLKLNLSSRLEANAMFGLDNAFSSSFDSIVLPAASNALTLSARNSSVVGNVIFHPRSSIIISPEYRRILSWRYTGPSNAANIYTLSFGYQF